MATLPHRDMKNETAALPIARIDTTDEQALLLLREYLATHGVQVFVNTAVSANVTYRIVAGDAVSVKSILQTRHLDALKQLVILWDEDPKSVASDVPQTTKIAAVDAKGLTHADVVDLCSFFFTSRVRILDRRTNPKPYRAPVDIPKTPTTPPPVEHFPKPRETSETSWLKTKILDRQRQHESPTPQPPSRPADQPKITEPPKPTVEDATRIARTIESVFTDQQPAKKRDTHIRIPPNILKRVAWSVGAIIGLSLLPFYWYFICLSTAGLSLMAGGRCLARNDTACARNWATTSMTWTAFATDALGIVRPAMSFFSGDDGVSKHDRLMTLFSTSAALLKDGGEVTELASSFAKTLLLPSTDSQGVAPVVAVERLKNQLFSIRTNLDIASVTLDELAVHPPFPLSIKSAGDKMGNMKSYVTELRGIASYVDRFLVLYPKLGGFRDKATYLVLLQNSSELRPTGGFIGSFMRVSVADGKIADLNVEDVYTADGQLKGHVDPPLPIREILGQEHWYLRDSNWNPDFAESAKKAIWFYEKEMGETPMGVVAITSSFIIDLLKVTGPVDLPDFNDRITAENFFAKSLAHTQEGFFPGSTKKKDFLGSLVTAVMDKLTSGKNQDSLGVFRAVIAGLRSRDIQMYVSDPETESAIDRFGWAGKYPARTACDSSSIVEPCTLSYAAMVEANLGVNKTNAFIERTKTRDVAIAEDGGVAETLVRSIKNTSNGEPGTGAYRAYVRVLIPSGVEVVALTLDGKPVPARDRKAKRPTMPYGELTDDIPGVTSVGLAFEVPPGGERTIRVTTRRPPLPFGIAGSRLELFEQKQAGVRDIPGTVVVRFPSAWHLESDAPQSAVSLANPGRFEYNSTLSADEHIRMIIKKSL